MEKYGFVYIWYDCKYKRYYIGAHWGHENDGYICSSTWMRNSKNRRPQDFKRRILSKIDTSWQDTLLEEQKWLDLIHQHELGVRYYNRCKVVPGQSRRKAISEETRKKQSEAKKGKRLSFKTEFKKGQVPWNKGLKGAQVAWNKGITGEQNHNFGKPRSEEVKKKISESQKGVSRKSGMQGKKHSEETKLKISQSKRRAV